MANERFPLVVVNVLPDGSTWCFGKEGLAHVGASSEPERIKTDASTFAEISYTNLFTYKVLLTTSPAWT